MRKRILIVGLICGISAPFAGATGGGIIITGSEIIPRFPASGAIKVIIKPNAAANAGGGWKLKPEKSYQHSGVTRASLAPGKYILKLTEVPGFQKPAAAQVTIRRGTLMEITYTYAPITTPSSSESALP